jgi:hypothetical protein
LHYCKFSQSCLRVLTNIRKNKSQGDSMFVDVLRLYSASVISVAGPQLCMVGAKRRHVLSVLGNRITAVSRLQRLRDTRPISLNISGRKLKYPSSVRYTAPDVIWLINWKWPKATSVLRGVRSRAGPRREAVFLCRMLRRFLFLTRCVCLLTVYQGLHTVPPSISPQTGLLTKPHVTLKNPSSPPEFGQIRANVLLSSER